MRASESDRGLICPASLVLPRYGDNPKSKDAADFGTLAHYWKETGTIKEGASGSDVKLLEEKILLSGVDPVKLWPAGGRHEVTFAIRIIGELKLIEYNGPRDGADEWKKSFGPEWLTGTMDFEMTGPRLPWVDDLKTSAIGKVVDGRWDYSAWRHDPKDNPQLLSYALVNWIRTGCDLAYVCGVSITLWPKYPKGKPPQRRGVKVTGLELAEHLTNIRYAITHPGEVNPSNEAWTQCAFCKCREPFPASEWMQSYNYRTFPACLPGLAKLIEKE